MTLMARHHIIRYLVVCQYRTRPSRSRKLAQNDVRKSIRRRHFMKNTVPRCVLSPSFPVIVYIQNIKYISLKKKVKAEWMAPDLGQTTSTYVGAVEYIRIHAAFSEDPHTYIYITIKKYKQVYTLYIYCLYIKRKSKQTNRHIQQCNTTVYRYIRYV